MQNFNPQGKNIGVVLGEYFGWFQSMMCSTIDCRTVIALQVPTQIIVLMDIQQTTHALSTFEPPHVFVIDVCWGTGGDATIDNK